LAQGIVRSGFPMRTPAAQQLLRLVFALMAATSADVYMRVRILHAHAEGQMQT
jgi:hypothetical protein